MSAEQSQHTLETLCEVVAFAPHPDDAEIGCGGLLALLTAQGARAMVVDLTEGEMASQGSVAARREEARAADQVLGLQPRHNLMLPDGGLNEHAIEQVQAVVRSLRQLQPRLVLAPYWESRHPDHAAASALVTRAVFNAALKNFQPGLGARHQVPQVLYYAIRRTFAPSFITDVGAHYDKKRAALRAYSSQVNRVAEATVAVSAADTSTSDPGPLISSPLSLTSIEARDRFFGSQIGVEFGEAFAIRSALAVKNPLQFFSTNPVTGALLYDREW